jgi:hypothetical protein
MPPVVAVIAPGSMGAAVGGRLVEQGVKVLTSLTGRSPDTIERARVAGLVHADPVEARLRELSFLNKGVRIILNDLREKEEENGTYTKTFYSEGGIVEFVEMLDSNAGRSPLLPKVIFVEGRDEATNVAVEVAMIYNDSYSEHIYSYVNNINTIEGGTHVSGFRRALTRVFKSYGDKQNLFEKAYNVCGSYLLLYLLFHLQWSAPALSMHLIKMICQH